MAVIYIDRVFVLNTLVDYLLLLSTVQLAGAPLRRIRLLLCAAAGGAYAALTFLPALAWLSMPVCKIAAGAGMALLAFWRQSRRWRMLLLFFLLSGALGGILLAVGLLLGNPTALWQGVYQARINWPILLGTTAVFALLFHLIFRQSARHALRGELLRVTVILEGKAAAFFALYDSGNVLRDPVRGLPVLVAEAEVLSPLWDAETAAILCTGQPPPEKLLQLQRTPLAGKFCLLPFQSVGEEHGVLLAVRADAVEVGNKSLPHILVALSAQPVCAGGGHALWGGEERGIEKAVESDSDAALPPAGAGRRLLHRRQRDAAPPALPHRGSGTAGAAGRK